MATTISTQDLIDVKRDIEDIGKAVNEKVIVSPRYGEDFKSLPMISAEFQISSDAAEAAAVSAAESANIAEAAATAATIGAGVFKTPEAGVDPVTGVADGAYFNVRSSSDESYVDEYQNIGGVPTPTGKTYPSAAALSEVKEAIIDPVTGNATASKVYFSNGRTIQERSEDVLNLKDYHELKVGDDWSDALIQAVADGKAQSKSLYIPGGTYDYSKSFTIEIPVFGAGYQVTRLRKTAPATITILKGGLNEIKVSPDAVLPDDTSNGVVLDGVDRKDCFELWSERHGGHGIEYRRGNLSRLVVRSRGNAGRGVNMAADTISGDNKACELFIEATANGLSGFYIEQHTNAAYRSSAHKGTIRSQNNGSRNITDDNYDVVLTAGGQDLNIYAEYGEQSVWHRDGFRASRVFYSSMSHASFRDDAANDSNLVSYVPSASGTRTLQAVKAERLVVLNEKPGFSGRLALMHVSNNTFRFEATLSGAQQYLELPANLTLRGENNSYNFAKRNQGGGTLTFGSIPAKSSVERTLSVPSAVSSLQTAVIANPAGDIGSNLMWNCYVSSFDAIANTTTVTIRVTNPTDAAIASNALAWRVQVIT